ncbi:MAG: TonB C-terminal domain-containing protein [Methylacidiphilales bacterium]|nr:TonB C-terminal domain-containing protein [Candidatus Methylacidiphilales bacterium]
MKHTTGYAQPRRLASPKKQVRLDLRRNPGKTPDGEPELESKSSFWKWFGFVALLHVIIITGFYFLYQFLAIQPPPPEQFISLLPPGNTVKGTPGVQQAPKVGASTPAPAAQHAAPPPPPPQPVAIQPKPAPVPKPIEPQPVVQSDVPPLVPEKPVVKPPPKVKVKVDLTQLVDGPAPDKPVKPKPHHKKPVAVTHPDDNAPDTDTPSSPDNNGLSREQIAAQLGQKLAHEGTTTATATGTSGSANSHPNSFADFYAAIHDQVLSKWTPPNLADATTVNPIIRIHVEKDGRVPPELVTLIRSSGNSAYDDSAVSVAKSLGYLYQPLPDGCPPDIPITFNLTR